MIRDERIVAFYPNVLKRDSGNFNLVKAYTKGDFIILAYLVDLNNKESREKYVNTFLQYGAGAVSMCRKLMEIEKYTKEIKTRTIKELSSENEKKLDGFLRHIEKEKIPQIQHEARICSNIKTAGLRRLVKTSPHEASIILSDLPLLIYLLPRIDATRGVLGTESPLYITCDNADEYRWRLKFEKEVADLLKFEKIIRQPDGIEIIYKPILKSDINKREIFDISSEIQLNLLFSEA